MKTKSPLVALACGAAAIALTLTGCSQGSAEAGGSHPKRIAFLTGSTDSPYAQAEQKGVQDTIKKAGYQLDVQTSNYDPSRQSSQCDNVIASGKYAGIVIIPAAGSALVPCVQDASAAGIKVVSLETQIGPDLYGKNGVQVPQLSGQVYQDARTMVHQWAQMALESCKDKPTCNVAIVMGDPAYPDQAEGRRVWAAEAAKNPKLKIVADAVGGFSNPNGGISAVQNLVQSHPDIDTIAVFDDETATGVVSEVAREGLSNIKVIGFGGNAVAIDRIKQGTQFGSMVFLPLTTASAAATMLLDAIDGKKIANNSVDSATLSPLGDDNVSVTNSNVERFKPEY